jgi:Ca-activated chloride channel homolog
VLIPVSVTDVRDRVVTGLAREHFKLYENHVEQSITHFASEDAPVSICIVFDSSGSMGPKLRNSREAVAQVLKTANPNDEFALIQFDQRAQLSVQLTDRAEEVQNRLAFIQSKGETALLDAIYLAVQTMKKAHRTRKAVIIISDGGDNCSRYGTREVKNLVREADVQIFAIGILERFSARGRTLEELMGPGLLHEIAEETGGRMFGVENPDELPGVATQIGIALRNQYLLGYSPRNVERDGKYHRVQVKVIQGLPQLRLSWRLGYYAPAR